MPETAAREVTDRIIRVVLVIAHSVIKVIIGHGVFNLRREGLGLVEVKTCAALDDIGRVQRVAEQSAARCRCVREDFGDVNFIKSTESVVIKLESDEVAVSFEVAADFHATEIREAVVLAPNQVGVNDCDFHEQSP